VLLAGEEGARASHAGLHFIQQQQRAGLLGDAPEAGQKAGRGRQNATFPLYRLHDDGGQVRTHRSLHRPEVPIGQMRDAAVVRAESLAVLGATGHGQRAQGATVERFFESDDAIAIFLPLQIEMVSSELEQRFVGFGSRVAEKCSTHPCSAAELSRQEDVGLVVEVIGHVNEAAHLFGDGGHVTRMRVSE
jgi:hypothetical protein